MGYYDEQIRDDFDRVYHRALLGDLLARLRRSSNDLLAYHEVRRALVVTSESARRIQVVPVARIVGSTDRARDFDRFFRPRRSHVGARWRRVARAHVEGKALPPVQLVQIGDAYFVRDGHHRVSVARVRDQPCVDAEVVEVLAQPLIRLASEASPPWIEAPGIIGALRSLCRRALVVAGFTASRGRSVGSA